MRDEKKSGIFLKVISILDGHVYAGAVTDFSGLDAGIHRDGTLRTEQFDPKHLNGETFKPNKKIIVWSMKKYFTNYNS